MSENSSLRRNVVFIVAIILFGIFSLGSNRTRESERTAGGGQVLST